MQTKTRVRSGAWRSRWAAVGAAVAVTLGAGSMVAVNAASSDPSSFVAITPTRILDTRTDVGLAGPFVSGVSQTLQVTGTVPTQPPNQAPAVNADVVPAESTSVVFNVTVVAPSTKGFLSIRPGDASGDPATSNINWAAGGANIANAVTVQLPASGEINIFVNGTVGHVLIDVAGYNVPASSGPAGPAGEDGADGATGPPGGSSFAESSTESGFTLINNPAAIVTLTVTAPTVGHVTLNSTAHVRHTGDAGDDVLCAITKFTTIPATTLVDEESVQWFERAVSTANFGENANLSGTRRFATDAGAVTYALACQKTGSDVADVPLANLTAIFTPAP